MESTRAGAPAVPPAQRSVRRTWWQDVRFLGGVALIAGCAVIGGVLVGGADRTAPVWAATRDLPAGATLTQGDLATVPARLDGSTAGRYLDGGSAPPIGAELARAVSGGELISEASIREGEPTERRVVTVSVEAARAPVGLSRGDRVDVYVTPRSEAGRTGTTARVLERGLVDAVDSGDRRFGGSSDRLSAVIVVPEAIVERVIAGTRRGDIDLVRVETSMARP